MAKVSFQTVFYAIIIIFSILGLWSSLALSIELVHLLEQPDAPLTCDINAAVSCSSIMETEAAEVLGFPNTFIGLIGYAVMLTIGGLGLFRVKFPGFVFLSVTIGAFGAFIFSYWLMYYSVYGTGVLCPYCILSCISATLVFFSFLLIGLQDNMFKLRESHTQRVQKFIAKGYYIPAIILWFGVMTALVVIEFSSNDSGLFG